MPTNTDDRDLDLHNVAIDETLARTGRCGAVHLPTGRTCLLPARHSGGCAFGGTSGAASGTATAGHETADREP